VELADLIALSRAVGTAELDCVILGEGNTSAKHGSGSFYVKASGTQLALASEDTFVRARSAPILAALAGPQLSDQQTRGLLADSVEDGSGRVPSTEAFMHALLLSLPGVEVVVHTHPTPLISILCLENWEEISRQRLFPDEIVCCGPRACTVPYADPGQPLAREIRRSVQSYAAEEGGWPKTIWIQNHGLICPGATPQEALTATRMSVKAARIWLGILQTGEKTRTLSEEQIRRIHGRPDEHFRQAQLWTS
jgi:L-ribulose-5-phosphate 4-epimerase